MSRALVQRDELKQTDLIVHEQLHLSRTQGHTSDRSEVVFVASGMGVTLRSSCWFRGSA